MLRLHTSSAPSTEPSCTAAKLREVYERFREADYGDITNTVYALLSPLPRAAVIQAAKDFGIRRRLTSKAQTMAAVAAVIVDRKGSWDRCQFRGGDE